MLTRSQLKLFLQVQKTIPIKIASQSGAVDLYPYFPVLKQEDANAVVKLNQLQQSYNPEYRVKGDGDYGFMAYGNLPSGGYSAKTITKASSTDWTTTGEFSSIAANHCGATAVTGLARYFDNRGFAKLKKTSIDATYRAVHAIVGHGPAMTIAGSAKTSLLNCGHTLSSSFIGTYSGMTTAVSNQRPSGILLANGIVAWHWIICE